MHIALPNCSSKPFQLILVSVVISASAFWFLASPAQGQELRNAIRDYSGERIFNYQPSDPQYRGKAFNIHTKHYGRFYNCDHQEDKRHSPYICWKPHYENDFPPRVGFCQRLLSDIEEVKQRIRDGAAGCDSSCCCKRCKSNGSHHACLPDASEYSTSSDCHCAQCNAPDNLNLSSISSENVEAQTQSVFPSSLKHHWSQFENHRERKYGLVQGKILQPSLSTQPDPIAAPVSDTVSDNTELATNLPFVAPEQDTIKSFQANRKQFMLKTTEQGQPQDTKNSSSRNSWSTNSSNTDSHKISKRPEDGTRYR